MAERNEKVLEAVKRAVKKNPDVTANELQPKMAKMDSSISDLGTRSFNASYVLPIKRKMSPSKPKKKATRKKASKKKTRAKSKRTAKGGRAEARELVLSRDQKVLDVMDGKDPEAAYELGANIDEYLDKLAELL